MQKFDETTIQLIKKKSRLDFSHVRDFSTLSAAIHAATAQYLSENTLRRLMGATPNNSEARPSTLDAIANYLGYINWKALEENNHGSGFRDTRKVVTSSDLQIGQHLEIIYPVDRLLRIRLVRENIFLVEECTSSNLHPNDELHIMMAAEGQTLFVLHVYRNGKDIGQYTAGEVGGLSSIRVY